jgi:hypothetical protein
VVRTILEKKENAREQEIELRRPKPVSGPKPVDRIQKVGGSKKEKSLGGSHVRSEEVGDNEAP